MAKKKAKQKPAPPADDAAELLKSAFPDGFSIRDEANSLVAYAIRNGPLEDLHAGKSSKLLERDDLSRITNAEMKRLILFACEKVEFLLRLKTEDPEKYRLFIMANGAFYCQRWDR